MAWKDQILAGSFKGLNFKTRSTDTGFTRNIISHSYVLTNDVFSEDLGKQADQYTLEIFFIGDNYFTERDSFITACSDGKAGTLIHPYLGQKEVFVSNFSIRENAEDGGMSTVTVTFIEKGASKFPVITEDRNFRLNSSIENVRQVSSNNFVNNIQLLRVTEFARGGFNKVLNPVMLRMDRTLSGGSFINNILLDGVSNFARIRANFNSLLNPLPTLLSSAPLLASLLIDTFVLINSTTDNGAPVRNIFKAGRDAVSVPVPATTEQNKIHNDNQDITTRFIYTTCIACEAETLLKTTFESRNEALEVRQDIVNQINLLLNSSTDDTEYQALQSLKAETINFLPPDNLDLPSVKSVTINETIPSLVLAYQIYNSIDNNEDIINRNKVLNPNFLSPVQKYEVLING
jgi:prophage DNA circulation protein